MGNDSSEAKQIPPESDADSERTVCFCHNVSWAQLVAAIREGSNTLELVKANTCASTGCGGCEFDVIEVLEAELNKPN